MAPKNPPPDSSISKNVSRVLANCGLRAPCQIRVQTRRGEVTLAGHVIYPHQKASAVQAIQRIEGVLRVIDQLKVRPPVKHDYKTLPPLPKAEAKPPDEAAQAEAAEAAAEETAAAQAAPAENAAPGGSPTDRDVATPAAPSEPENLSDSTEFELGPAPVKRPSAKTTPNGPAH